MSPLWQYRSQLDWLESEKLNNRRPIIQLFTMMERSLMDLMLQAA